MLSFNAVPTLTLFKGERFKIENSAKENQTCLGEFFETRFRCSDLSFDNSHLTKWELPKQLPEKSAVSATTVVNPLRASRAFSCLDRLAAGAISKQNFYKFERWNEFFISRDFFQNMWLSIQNIALNAKQTKKRASLWQWNNCKEHRGEAQEISLNKCLPES